MNIIIKCMKGLDCSPLSAELTTVPSGRVTYSQGAEKVGCNDCTLYPDREFFHYVKLGPGGKVRYNGGYVVNGVHCNVTRLYVPLIGTGTKRIL